MYNKGAKSSGKVVAPNKLWHAFKHKNFDVFKLDLDAEEDQNYVSASERFLEFQTQLGMVLHHTTCFRKTLEESLQQAVELADDFGRISSGQGNGRTLEPWASSSGKKAFFLKGMLEESVESLRQHLHIDLEEKVIRSLREEVATFSTVHNQMNERANMKVEMLHYSKKLEELRGVKAGQKNLDEKVDRNKEKYAQASQALRDQTNQLMSVFAHAEQLRQRLLTQDMPAVISCERSAFEAFSANLNKAVEEDGSQPRLSPATAIPHRVLPSGDFPNTPPIDAMADVSLDDAFPGEQQAFLAPLSVKMDPPPPCGNQPTIVKKRSPTPMSPSKSGAPWSGSANGGGEFGQELKRAHEHQNSKMAAESASSSASGMASATTTSSSLASSSDVVVDTTPERTTTVGESSSSGGRDGDGLGSAEAAATDAAAVNGVSPDSPMPERPEVVEVTEERSVADGVAKSAVVVPSSPAVSKDVGDENHVSVGPAVAADEDGVEQGGGEADNGHAGEEERTEEEEVMGELEPGKVRVRALYDYEATQEGDLSFLAGDIIVTDGGAFSGEGWVTGDCDGRSGMFPANYTEPW